MAVYDIGGARYELPDDITQEQLQSVVAQLHGGAAAAAAAPAAAPSTQDDNNGVLASLQQGAHDITSSLGTTFNSDTLKNLIPAPEGYHPAVPDIVDAMHKGDAAGVVSKLPQAVIEQSPQLAASLGARSAGAAAGGLIAGPAGAAIGAIAAPGALGFAETYGPTLDARMKAKGTKEPDFEDKAYATVASLIAGGADAFALRSIFGSKVVDGVVKNFATKGIKASLEQGASGAIQSATQQAAETAGTPGGLQIDPAAVGAQALTQAATGATAEGLHSLSGARAPDLEPAANGLNKVARSALDAIPDVGAPDPADHAGASQRLSQRILTEAKGIGADLSDVTYGSNKGAEQVMENVHNQLAEEMKANAAVLRDRLDPLQAVRLDQLVQRATAQASLRDARNKRKSTVSQTDFQNLQNLVGDTVEGKQLIDLMRQSNELTGIFRQGMKGGLSQYTDYFNPVGRGGSENSPLAALTDSRIVHGLGTIGAASATGGASLPVQLGIFGAGRLVDRFTGNRSRVLAYVNRNIGRRDAQPVDTTGARSVLEDAALAKEADAAQAAADAARGAELRGVRRAADDPGLGGFDNLIWQKTGLRPYEVNRGALALLNEGRISPQELHALVNDPESLMRGNRGNLIMDMLNDKAHRGELQRDPEWTRPQDVPAAPVSVSLNAPNTAYVAQAHGNQTRVTAAANRIAQHPGLTPDEKQAIGSVIARIGATNNRQDAKAALDFAIRGLNRPLAKAIAGQEISPLINQIRHSTPEAARAASARPQPLAPDVTKRSGPGKRGGTRPIERKRINLRSTDRLAETIGAAVAPGERGNPVSRLRAQLYKVRAGVKKGAFSGPQDPHEGYLKAVADFHDKAVHDPNDPAVKKSYAVLAKETIAQFKALGDLKVETWRGEGEPYKNSADMMRDVSENRHLWFLPTDNAFGEGADAAAHPMLKDTGLKTVDGHRLLVNDVFRIVHDFFGHTQGGYAFGPKGEYNAFREHAQMFSDAALPALAAETLAQNAWVNFGPHMRRPDGSIPQKGDPDYVPQNKRPFSDQKAYVLPKELLARDPNLPPDEARRLRADAAVSQRGTGGAAGRRVSTTGHYVGAPEGITSPQKLAALRANMERMAREGEPGRFWYERSGRALLNAVGGDRGEAEKLAQLIAIFSPQTPVPTNMDYALQAYLDAKAGRPIKAGMFPGWMSKAAEGVMRGEPWSGRKTNNFYVNLMREIDPSLKQGVTTDIWVLRALGYKTENPTEAQYDFATKEITRLADKMGWEPQQVQAAIWVTAKAGKEGIPVKDASFDFKDAIERSLAQISWESIPGRTAQHLPEMFNAPVEQRAEYHEAISKAFLDDEGHDMLAKALHLPSPGEFEAPGYFEGKTNPGSQTYVAAPRAYKGAPYGELNRSAREAITAYAAAKGILLHQDAMAWHRPFSTKQVKVRDMHGAEVRAGRPFTPDEVVKFAETMKELSGGFDMAPIGAEQGARFLNYEIGGGKRVFPDAKSFHKAIDKATMLVFPQTDTHIGWFAYDGDLIDNDWSQNPNGEAYYGAVASDRPDLQRAVRDVVSKVRPRVEAVDTEFAAKYGWTPNPRLAGSGE